MHIIRWTAVVFALAATGATCAAAGGAGGSPGFALGVTSGMFRYAAIPSSGRTVVAVIQRQGGQVIRFNSIPGAWAFPMVAYDGTAEGPSRDGTTLVLASLRPNVSKFAFLATDRLRSRQTVTLHGRFAYDAISPDAQTLYLIQYLQRGAAGAYYVRAYDLAQRRLLDRIIFDRRDESSSMSGTPVTRTTSPSGRWVYTLYQRGPGAPFVHALDTVGRRAVCIDLPRLRDVWKLRVKLRGGRLVVRWRGANETAATIDTRTLRMIGR